MSICVLSQFEEYAKEAIKEVKEVKERIDIIDKMYSEVLKTNYGSLQNSICSTLNDIYVDGICFEGSIQVSVELATALLAKLDQFSQHLPNLMGHPELVKRSILDLQGEHEFCLDLMKEAGKQAFQLAQLAANTVIHRMQFFKRDAEAENLEVLDNIQTSLLCLFDDKRVLNKKLNTAITYSLIPATDLTNYYTYIKRVEKKLNKVQDNIEKLEKIINIEFQLKDGDIIRANENLKQAEYELIQAASNLDFISSVWGILGNILGELSIDTKDKAQTLIEVQNTEEMQPNHKFILKFTNESFYYLTKSNEELFRALSEYIIQINKVKFAPLVFPVKND